MPFTKNLSHDFGYEAPPLFSHVLETGDKAMAVLN